MTDNNPSPGWAIYLRVSDEDKQTPERSFAMQREKISEQLLSSSNLEFKREYFDILTGTTINRADYQLMLADAAAGKFSHLGLYRADRFGRNAVEGLQAATKLISQGIKIRVANMPTLTPEEPDGFFMFLLQMGLAQREVDVLRMRTSDGMRAKMRAGGWSNRTPEGYLNKERPISNGKYDRWVEKDPVTSQILREAWDLLLTNRYTLIQICEELNNRGYMRSNGCPWAWTDPQTGIRHTAKNRLHEIFHNPFYAGWVVSRKANIPFGEVQGKWEPLVTTEEYEKGVEILRKHDAEKSREKKMFYLLRNILWIKEADKLYRLYGSSPTGRLRSYSYYITHAKPYGKKIHIPCDTVNSQIPLLLQGINIDPDLFPSIRNIYKNEVAKETHSERENKIGELRRRVIQLREEESRLGRLFITGKMNESSYEHLRSEWQEKKKNAEANLEAVERDISKHIDDLDLALSLMSKVSVYFEKLIDKNRSILLQIIIKRIIVNSHGDIIDFELNPPFAYLMTLVKDYLSRNDNITPSENVRAREPKKHIPNSIRDVRI